MPDNNAENPTTGVADEWRTLLIEWAGLPDHEPTIEAFLEAIPSSSIPEACATIGAQFVDLCEECEAAIPTDEAESLPNPWHAETCSQFDPGEQ